MAQPITPALVPASAPLRNVSSLVLGDAVRRILFRAMREGDLGATASGDELPMSVLKALRIEMVPQFIPAGRRICLLRLWWTRRQAGGRGCPCKLSVSISWARRWVSFTTPDGWFFLFPPLRVSFYVHPFQHPDRRVWRL